MAKGFVNVKNVNQSDIDNIDLLLEDIKALIGQTNHTDGSATAGAVMAKLNKLLTDWTTTRAGKIDTINTNASNVNTRLTATRAGYLDKLANFGATGDTGGTSTAGTLTAKINAALSNIGVTGDTSGTATAGTLMAKVNKLLTDWTTTRAGKIDTISTNASNLNTRLTSTRAGYLDKLANFGAVNDTGGTATAGTVMAKLNKLLTDWTTTRAGYIDTINTNTACMTSTRAGYIDKLANFGATGDTGGTSSAGTLTAKVNKLLTDWTTTRAGYISNIYTYTSNLNTRLTSTRAGYLDKLANFGAIGDTGGSETEGTAMAKLNAILQKVITEGVGIKSVQRGTFQETGTSQDKETSITVRLSTIKPAKTFIIINGGLSAGYSGSSSAVRGYIGSVSATNFVYQTGRASMTITSGFISWQAVEFY